MVKEHCGCFVSEEGLGIRVIVGQKGEGICAACLENKHEDIGRDLDRKGWSCIKQEEKTLSSRTYFPLQSLEFNFINQLFWRMWFSPCFCHSRCSRKLFTSVRDTWLELLALISRSVDIVSEIKGSLLCTWSTPHPIALSEISPEGLDTCFLADGFSSFCQVLLHLQQESVVFECNQSVQHQSGTECNPPRAGVGCWIFDSKCLQLGPPTLQSVKCWTATVKWGQDFLWGVLGFEMQCSLWAIEVL